MELEAVASDRSVTSDRSLESQPTNKGNQAAAALLQADLQV